MAPLQPLQQTVFEQGPQAATVPTGEPIPVYQEGQVILPEPINPAAALDPGIAWNALGAETMKLAQNMVTETWDYLIKTKANSVAELGDKYQTQLNELYQKQTTEMYNARTQKRLTNAEIMQELSKGIQKAKDDFRKEATTALGGDEFFAKDIRMGDWGLKYQDLAVLTRRTMRDLDTQASKLLYDSQRVLNGVEKKEANHLAWVRGGVGLRPGKNDLQAQFLNGTRPLPVTPKGFPVMGFETDPQGNPTKPKSIMIENQEIPLVYQQEDGSWYTNPIALEAASWDDLRVLYDLETSGSDGSTGIMSLTSGQLTVEMQERVEAVLKGQNPNQGERAFVATIFAAMPDNLYENMLSNLTLNDTDRGMADMFKLAARSGKSPQELTSIQALRGGDLQANVGIVRALATMSEIPMQQFGPRETEQLKIAASVLGHLVEYYGFKTDVEDFTLDREGQYFTDTEGLSAYSVLQHNPGLKGALLYTLTLAQKSGINLENAEQLNTFMQAAVNRSGQVVVPNPLTGVPNFVYAPNLVWAGRLRNELESIKGLDDTKQETWPEEIQEQLKDNPQEVDRLFAKSYWYSTDWMRTSNDNQDPRDYMMRAARKINPYVDMEVFEALLDAGVVSERSRTGYQTQAALPFGQFVKMVVASSKSVLEGSGKSISYADPNKLAEINERLEAAKIVLDDLDIFDPKNESELGFSTDIPDLNFMASPRGGMGLQFRALKGTSGKDYLRLLTADVSAGGFSRTAGGPYTVRQADGTPFFYIPAETSDPNVKQVGEYLRHRVNIQKYISALNGTYRPTYVSASKETAPAAGPPNPQAVIPLVTEPAMRPTMDILLDGEQPLTTFNQFLTFKTVNNDSIWGIVNDDPILKDLKALKYEVATEPGGIRMYDPNKTLFSEKNLEALFNQAVRSGAKTNNDMLGFMFKAMELYRDNPSYRFGREVTLEQDTKSTPQDFLGTSGKNKGVVLYSQQSNEFYEGISIRLNEGYNLYKRGDKFFMFKPNEVPTDTKLTLVFASGSPEANASIFAPFAKRKTNADIARSILFTKSEKNSEVVSEPATISPKPSEPAVPMSDFEIKQKQIQADFEAQQEEIRRRFSSRND